jgi:hypothetical protein
MQQENQFQIKPAKPKGFFLYLNSQIICIQKFRNPSDFTEKDRYIFPFLKFGAILPGTHFIYFVFSLRHTYITYMLGIILSCV